MIRCLEMIEPKEIAIGVVERVLVSSENTSYKILNVKLLTIEPEKEASFLGREGETVIFILDGRGTFTENWIKADWPHTIRANTAICVPPNIGCRIRNCGEALLRCLVGTCSARPELDERFTSVEVTDLSTVTSISYTGWQSKMLFTREFFRAKGLAKFSLCAYNTLSPGASLNSHVPTGICEEIMYVTRGEGKMRVADEQYTVKPGCLVYVPVDTIHSVQNTGRDMLDFFVLEDQR